MPTYRTAPLPRGWDRKRRRILRIHAGICHLCGLGGATEVDHVLPTSRGGSDADDNLRPIHGFRDVQAGRATTNCHGTKTAREAGKVSRKRAPERHPGEVTR